MTGATGFIGRHLLELLRSEGHEVWGTVLVADEARLLPPSLADVPLVRLDIRDRSDMDRVIETIRPEAVFHLAAQAYPLISWQDPAHTLSTNILGTTNLYEALRKWPAREGVVVASSGATYGVQERLPIVEDVPLRPMSPYGVSKAACDMLSYQYAKNFGMRIVRARLFGTTGPGKQGDAPGDFALQLARIERQMSEAVMRVGNLETRRDISDVRDVVRAFYLLLLRGSPEEPVNVGSGRTYLIRDVLEMLLAACRVRVLVETDPRLLRPVDEATLWGDIGRLRKLGFVSQYSIETTLTDSLDYWRTHEPLAQLGGLEAPVAVAP